MNTVQRVTKNALALYAAYIVAGLLGFFLTISIARMLGDVTFGKYSFALAFVGLFTLFLDLGFGTLIVRDVSRDKSLASKYAGNIIVIKVILSIVVFGVIALAISLMDYPRDTTTAVLILGVYIGFIALGDTFKFIFRAFEKMEYDALVWVSRQIITVSLGLAALFLGYGLIEVVCAFAIGSVLDFILGLVICGKRFAKPKIEIDFGFWKKITKVSLPMGLIFLATALHLKIDTVMLSSMKGDAVVGWYSAAYSLIYVLRQVPFLLMMALLPLLSGLFVSSQTSLKSTYERALRYLFILGLPIAAGTCLLADRFILLFYGDQYTNSIVALQFLAWNVLFFFLYQPLYITLIAINRQGRAAAIAWVCAVINVILNLLLIPPLSYVGAAIAAIVTQMVLCGATFYIVSRYLYRPPVHKMIAKPVVACSAMALLIYFCGGISLPLLVFSAAVLYLAALYLLKEFSAEDINMAKQAIKVLRFNKRR